MGYGSTLPTPRARIAASIRRWPGRVSTQRCCVTTGKWGDVVPPFAGGPAPQPDFGDIASLIDKFQAMPGSPIKARAQLQPNVPDPSQPIDFRDIADGISAFTGGLYPYDVPAMCP